MTTQLICKIGIVTALLVVGLQVGNGKYYKDTMYHVDLRAFHFLFGVYAFK